MGPLLFELKAEEIPIVHGVNDATNVLGLELSSAFESLRREISALDKLALPSAKKALASANAQHRTDFMKSFRDGAGIDLSKITDPSRVSLRRRKIESALTKRELLIDANLPLTFENAITQNVKLIKSIAPNYLDQVQAAIYHGLRNGTDGHDLKQMVMNLNGQNERRAKVIARDQLQKFNSALSQSRQQSIGVTGYIWRTSGDERVRPEHINNDGKFFKWNSPPPATGHPGEDVQCRCTAEPDLSSLVPWGADVFS